MIRPLNLYINIYQCYNTFHSIFRLLIMRWNLVDLSKMLTAVASMLQKNTFHCQISNQEEITQSPFRPCPKESSPSKDPYFKQHVSIDNLKGFWDVFISRTMISFTSFLLFTIVLQDHFICIIFYSYIYLSLNSKYIKDA